MLLWWDGAISLLQRQWAGCCGLGAVACGLWPVACGLWAVGCGLWAVGCGLPVSTTDLAPVRRVACQHLALLGWLVACCWVALGWGVP